jgi:hypothetical protein
MHPLPTRRLILLGASNLTRGLAVVLETAAQFWSEPLDILTAAGHGRSYGTISRVFGRSLPSIVDCGLWPALAARPALPTRALVTDIGNDLFYGAAPQQIAQWVATCFDRLQQHGARVTVTGLPLCNLPRVTPASYRVIVQMLFPGCRLPYAAAIQGACRLDELIRDLAAARQIPVVEPVPGWYGLDPVHIRLRHASAAWQAILGAGLDFESPPARAMVSPLMHLRAALLRPEQRWVLGREQRRAQPAEVFPNGTQVSLY